MTLNGFVSTQQRAVQSMHEQCNILKQQRRILQLEKITLERENLSMKQMSKYSRLNCASQTYKLSVRQIPGAAEHVEHQHRFSLPSSYVYGT